MFTRRNSTGIPEALTVGTAWRCTKGIPPILAILAILFIIAPIHAALVGGTYYMKYSPSDPINGTKIFYYNNETPQNDPKEWRVYPGDTIYLGGTYDLQYVMGVSKQFAWWKDWKIEGMDCNPSIVNTVSYIQTNGRINPKMVYIDPEKYKVGNWWQWDGCFIDLTTSSGETKWLPYKADNNLAFRIIYPPYTPTPTPTPEIYIPPPTPIKTITTPTINITPIETPVQDTGWPWWMWVIILLIVGGIIIFVLVM